jgi:hypothetical protein
VHGVCVLDASVQLFDAAALPANGANPLIANNIAVINPADGETWGLNFTFTGGLKMNAGAVLALSSTALTLTAIETASMLGLIHYTPSAL